MYKVGERVVVKDRGEGVVIFCYELEHDLIVVNVAGQQYAVTLKEVSRA